MPNAYKLVALERERQSKIWGLQNHPPLAWLSILGEEYGEACEIANDSFESGKASLDRANLVRELIQVAAVALAAVDSIQRQYGDEYH